MLNDYKGEKPSNVITEEEHKKRPFYKKVSFWVLSALGLFFGGCSVYGLVLGYQYVHAVTEAAHIIADANESDDSLSKSKNFLAVPTGYDDVFTFNFVLQEKPSDGFHLLKLLDGTDAVSSAPYPSLSVTFNGNNNAYFYMYLSGRLICMTDYLQNVAVNNCAYVPTGESGYGYFRHDGNAGWPMSITGQFRFKPYAVGYDDGYQEGYEEGSQDGYQDGYQEGYDDGYQALAGVQNVRILFDENFPTLNPINYSWKVDGTDVASGQIMLRPNQSAPVVNLKRPGGYTHKATLNIWSENDQPLVIAYGRHEGLVIGGTQTYIYDTYNKSNAYDWANSVWYVPTYNPTAGFLIYSYGTTQQGYINDYFFEFDPEHNDRAFTGIYADGYDQGYKDGTESGTAYDNGYGAGYDQGYDDGMTIGKAQGEAQAVGGQKALVTMFVTAFQQPFDQIYRFLNFNVLGLNILALFTALLTLSIGIIIIKKVI